MCDAGFEVVEETGVSCQRLSPRELDDSLGTSIDLPLLLHGFLPGENAITAQTLVVAQPLAAPRINAAHRLGRMFFTQVLTSELPRSEG
jgi:hypothetical protein